MFPKKGKNNLWGSRSGYPQGISLQAWRNLLGCWIRLGLGDSDTGVHRCKISLNICTFHNTQDTLQWESWKGKKYLICKKKKKKRTNLTATVLAWLLASLELACPKEVWGAPSSTLWPADQSSLEANSALGHCGGHCGCTELNTGVTRGSLGFPGPESRECGSPWKPGAGWEGTGCRALAVAFCHPTSPPSSPQ